jgi:hypothetical protein
VGNASFPNSTAAGAIPRHDLRLPVQRFMPRIFVDHERGHKGLGRNAVLDEPFGRWRLHHRPLAGPAAIFGSMCHDHPILRRNQVEPLGHIFPDNMQRTSAAGTDRVLGSDSNVDAGKMRLACRGCLFC